jgi:hypothetical protein
MHYTKEEPVDSKELQLKILFFRQGKWWIGQCLEHDIASQAKTVGAAIHEMQRMVVGHLMVSHKEKLGGTLDHLPRAPQQYWDEFEQSGILLSEVSKISLHVEQKIKQSLSEQQFSVPSTEMRLVA